VLCLFRAFRPYRDGGATAMQKVFLARAQMAIAIGVLATGTLDAATVTSLLQSLPEGTWELVSHPGYNDADLARAGTRLLASRETEREALQAVKAFPGIELISFAALTP